MEVLTAIEPIGRVFKPRGGESRQFIEDGGKTRIEVPPGPVQVVGTYTGNEQFGLFVWRGDGYIRLAKSPENTRGGVGYSATYLRDLRSPRRRRRLPLPPRACHCGLRKTHRFNLSRAARQLAREVA